MTAKILASADGLSGSLAVGANEAFAFKPIDGGLELSQDGIIFQTVDTNGKVVFPQNSALTSFVKVTTANGFGSTRTGVRRFTTVLSQIGSDITYEDSAANGASFTINTNGIYAITYVDSSSEAADYGVSINTAANGAPASLADILLEVTSSTANHRDGPSFIQPLVAGSVLRPYSSAANTGSTGKAWFMIVRIG